MLAAGLIGYEIGLRIRQPVRNWFAKLLDVSQPTTFAPEKEPRAVDFEVPYTPGVAFDYDVATEQIAIESSRFKCSNNEQVEVGSTSISTGNTSVNNAYGLRYSTDIAINTLVCSGGTGPAVEKTILLIEKADVDGNWSQAERTVGQEGTETSQFYYDTQDRKSIAVTGVEQDGEPLVVPNPYIEPFVEPIPKVDPEILPQEFPKEKPKVVPQPVIVPDAEPLPSTAPQPLPKPIPSPVLPAVAPVVQPGTEPAETQTTTQAGALTPKTPPAIITTPKGVHLFGKDGARVTGQTMRGTAQAVAQEVGRIEQKVAKMNTGFPSIGGLAELLFLLTSINDLLNSQKAGTTYELKSVCECPPGADDCEEETTKVETAGGYYVDAILSRLDALPTLLQAQKDYKQPICNPKPTLLGDFRTLAFISDSKSEFGNDRLRKQFRYRSQSAIDLGQLVDHWKDFVWDAGPVCVQHKGAWWGTPQVWASSADEGKRVIRYAGTEAGLNPDEVGEWIITGSSSSRYGQSGTMRICTKGGYYWITERLGSNNRPQVAKT